MRAAWTTIITTVDGGSRFGAGSGDMHLADFAPPAPPLRVSDPEVATGVRYLGAPAGWDSDFHPAPARQFVVMLRGSVRSGTTDGDTRTFGPGDVVLLEDTSGRGHRTTILGDEPWLAMVVALG